MSRTILLSEVNEVAGRYPEAIEQIRATLAGAQLPIHGEPALQALTERLEGKPLFQDDLHEALHAALAPVPQITQLEALAVLVHAAVGPEHAAALADSEAADVPLRALFKFVLASRRRSREAALEGAGAATEKLARAPGLPATEEREQTLSEPVSRPRVAAVVEPTAAAANYTETPARELVTASAPGGFGMLGRALAFAADQDPESRKTYIPDEPLPAAEPMFSAEALPAAQHLPVEAEPVAARAPRSQRRSERVPVRSVPVATAVMDAPEDEEEELDQKPRRWGMGTAVMCGVLMGFAVGAFMHFDHKTPAGPAATIAPAATQLAGNTKGKVKSVEELSAEIAALDSLANAPTPASAVAASRPERGTAPAVNSRRATTRLPDRQPAQRAYVPLPPAQDQQPATVVRSAGLNNSPTIPSATTGVRSAAASTPAALTVANAAPTPAPLVANNASGGVFHTASTMHLPHVVTGSAGIMAANLISSPAPAYPAAASAAGVQGEVVVEAVVGRAGEVVGTRVVSGPLLLRTAALEAVQHWHYRPYEVDGKPVEVATTARVEFRLDQ